MHIISLIYQSKQLNIMKPNRQLLLLFSCYLFIIHAQAQVSTFSSEVQKTIKAVEQSLSGWVQLDGGSTWSLDERMKYHKIKGVSIAVIKDYKIDWIKTYGWADEGEKRPVTPKTLFQAG